MNKRPRLSPTADRFLVARFVEPFVFSLGAFIAIYMLGDFFQRFDELMRYKSLNWLGLEYFVLRLPAVVSQLLPIACLIGVLLPFPSSTAAENCWPSKPWESAAWSWRRRCWW